LDVILLVLRNTASGHGDPWEFNLHRGRGVSRPSTTKTKSPTPDDVSLGYCLTIGKIDSERGVGRSFAYPLLSNPQELRIPKITDEAKAVDIDTTASTDGLTHFSGRTVKRITVN
jgi:hypothetical protein